ncbi:hypothetical protein [Undibacterium sp. TJN19]|uniref:hypothetical protein n=1 Tax=Undibacterium sp. TJN19 TaxID=3413055 RepID=UPI003BF3338A
MNKSLSCLQKNKRFLALLVLPVCLLVACQQKTPADQSSAKSNGDMENYQIVDISETWKAATYSIRNRPAPGASANSNDATTILTAMKKDKQLWQQVVRAQFDGAYNPRLSLHKEFTFQGNPLLILVRQQGAAVEQLDTFGIVDGQFKLLQSLEAGAFEWKDDAANSKKMLIAKFQLNTSENKYYSWDGKQFMENASTVPDTKSSVTPAKKEEAAKK